MTIANSTGPDLIVVHELERKRISTEAFRLGYRAGRQELEDQLAEIGAAPVANENGHSEETPEVNELLVDRLLEHELARREARRRADEHERGPASAADDGDSDLDTFCDSDEAEFDWLVPGLIERGDRIIVTGGEGHGKSTLNRQIGVQVSNGIHPFTLEEIPPVRVYMLDLENPEAHLRRELRKLREVADETVDGLTGLMTVRCLPQGLDLSVTDDRDWLRRRIAANRPELFIVGPAYKLASGDPTTEVAMKPVALLLDELRAEHGMAVLLEAHQPHAQDGRSRPERPYGWSGWARWPEFGLSIDEHGRLSQWRPARHEHSWPKALKRGGPWPWITTDLPAESDRPRQSAKDRADGRVLEFLHEHKWAYTTSQVASTCPGGTDSNKGALERLRLKGLADERVMARVESDGKTRERPLWGPK